MVGEDEWVSQRRMCVITVIDAVRQTAGGDSVSRLTLSAMHGGNGVSWMVSVNEHHKQMHACMEVTG